MATTLSPLMKQYQDIKQKYPDALLLFRVGDFYETFGQDAIKASAILGIVLTKRSNGTDKDTELAGFPYHSLDTYLPKLVKAGLRVAICEQLEDPKFAKKIVKRGVTELVSPGISYSEKILDNKQNNFLCSLYFGPLNIGCAFIDISTGEFFVTQGNKDYIEKTIQGLKPSELVYAKHQQQEFDNLLIDKPCAFNLDEWIFRTDYATELILKQFNVNSVKGFGIEELKEAIIAAGSILHYLKDNQQNNLKHVTHIARIEQDNYVWLDKFTMRNLELLMPTSDHGTALIHIIDKTSTPMGARLLKRWLTLPLKVLKPIQDRLEVVDYFYQNPDIAKKIIQYISTINDLERLISRVAVGKITPREILQLKHALKAIEPIKTLFENIPIETLQGFAEQLNPCHSLVAKIEKEIMPEPPVLVNKGNVIANGVSDELDELRKIKHDGQSYLLEIQQREIARTGIPSLKVNFNNVFGYFIEVTNTHKDKVPHDWIRKQTLVNAERYITEELKAYETKILGAEDRIIQIEIELFNQLVQHLTQYIQTIQINANIIAQIDCLLGFAILAKENNYCKPQLTTSKTINIKAGRHPVIEKRLPPDQPYVANDVFLDNNTQQIIMITGPNMSGKSAILRQTALITIMAQIGSFVPAQSAEIGLVDKIFTRVGASDNISMGESTFMVEMTETASILNNISDNSLILLDEIGRGTSTYDGISIAWAIAEYLHDNGLYRPKTLFATHYHELNDMAKTFSRIKNFNVSVKEIDNKILFLRKLVEGGSEHSFGIHVAQMAGMPRVVVERANKLLKHLENRDAKANIGSANTQSLQLSFFEVEDPILRDLRQEILQTNIDTLTPIEALMKLNEIKRLLLNNTNQQATFKSVSKS